MTRNAVAHLVGSVPLQDAEAVFTAVAESIGDHVVAIPDGETGDRIGWIRHLEEKLATNPDLQVDPDYEPFELRQWDGQLLRRIRWLRFRPEAIPDKVRFATGYADAAIESFGVFDRLQGEGVIRRGVRFQVSLPTPMAASYHYISPRARGDFVKAYQESLLGEVRKIVGHVPAERLAIQWDVCQEVLVFENYYPHREKEFKTLIFENLGQLGNAIPRDVVLGYHLCYGSPRDEHLVQPTDAGILAEVARGILDRVERRVDFMHMPVPKNRTDDSYFRPLDRLGLPDETALYLGLIHFDDEEGDRARLDAALAHVRVGGVSAECGWGRTDPLRVPGLLQSHRRILAGI